MSTISPTGAVAHLSPQERAANGKAARKRVPRDAHAAWSPSQRTHDPLRLLTEQEQTRVPDLIPIRHGRMAASPFAFYRGAALPMAADLATMPQTGLNVQLCGDAHLANFGGFASPERDLLFDVNDFDETAPGPFEWDVKRLAASLEIAGRGRGFDASTNRRVVRRAVKTYRETVRKFAGMHKLDIWYAKLDVAAILEIWGPQAGAAGIKKLRAAVDKAESKDRLKARSKLTTVVDGELRFQSDPPLLVPVEDLFTQAHEATTVTEAIHAALRSYRRTLTSDRRQLLGEYRFVHLARKVVGVGSVGTRCWLALFVGQDENDPLFLQVKEAGPSVLERFTGADTPSNHGQRVVEGQRLMQAASDIFLGWQRVDSPEDGVSRDFYVRQLWDWKASAAVDTMEPDILGTYGGMCAWTLARAHARSGDEIALGAYLGSGDAFDRALGEFAAGYADQNDVDHQALVDAIKDGTLTAEFGV
jgi:uncharacterized protein (DUF2252 family)